jgi:spore coat protein U-like protein
MEKEVNEIKKIIVSLMVALATLGSILPIVLTDDITASVTVNKNCGIYVDTTAINFGTIAPGSTSSSVTRTIQNTGTSGMQDCQYEISGTDWSSTVPQGFSMGSEQTDYKCNTDSGIECKLSSNFRDLPNSAEDFLGLDSQITANVNFQLSIPVNQAAGEYQQTITLTLTDGE